MTKLSKADREYKKILSFERKLRRRHKALKAPKKKPQNGISKKLNKYREELTANPTYYESKFRAALNLAGMKYRFQVPFFHNKFKCIVDFVVGDVAVEIDGKHHSDPEMVGKDTYRSEWLLMHRGLHTKRGKNADF